MHPRNLEEYLDAIDLAQAYEIICLRNDANERLMSQQDELDRLRDEVASLKHELEVVAAEAKAKKAPSPQPAKKPVSFPRRIARKVKKAVAKPQKRVSAPVEEPTPAPVSAPAPVSSITVVITTHKKNETIADAVASVLAQKTHYPLSLLIVVNCNNVAWYEELCARYAGDERVEILFTEKRGLSAAINVARDALATTHVMFLDDDDWLTENCIELLANTIGEGVDFAVCPVFSYKDGKPSDEYSYINDGIKATQGDAVKNSYLIWAFSRFSGKLMSTLFLKRCIPFDESLTHTEDVIFWAENYPHVKRKIPLLHSESEGYCRRITQDSLSRPTGDAQFAFYVGERLALIKRIEKLFFAEGGTAEYKNFLVNLIAAQTTLMRQYYSGLDEQMQAQVRSEIASYDGKLLKRCAFSEHNAIAFCHNFTPTNDPSAFVASKRLARINEEEGEVLAWHVFSKNMRDIRSVDVYWEAWYARCFYVNKVMLKGRTSDAPRAQIDYGVWAYWQAAATDARVIYSRSMFPGSHIAAYLYKKAHPQVTWYAEFSDPLSYNTFGKLRDSYAHPDSLRNPALATFYTDCEMLVHAHADKIIFTNAVQMDYMLDKLDDVELADAVRKRASVWLHPVIDEAYAHILHTQYELDENRINIGYFGSFYIRRGHDDLLKLTENDRVTLHLFVPKPETLSELASDTIRINPLVSQFEFLNLASRMDYLFLNDMDSLDGVTPWLPSKLSDYVSVGTRIIARCNEGSPMSTYESDALIKVAEVDDEVIRGLSKRTSDAPVR